MMTKRIKIIAVMYVLFSLSISNTTGKSITSEMGLNVTVNSKATVRDVALYQVPPTIESNTLIVINELMASNTNTTADPQGDYDDWVELYNKGTEDVNLTGMYLTDKVDNKTKWQFPDNTIIKAGEYLIVWTDEDSKESPGIHTNFKLSASGELVMLVNTDANGNSILDSVSFGVLADDISYGRDPNGTGTFRQMDPTPGALNDEKVSVGDIIAGNSITVSKLYPNPFYDIINFEISIEAPGIYLINIYDMMGRKVKTIAQEELTPGNYGYSWDSVAETGSRSTPGAYYLRLQSTTGFVSEQIILFDK